MKTKNYDVIIIGGGFAGLTIAYQLARHQVDVLLLEAGSLGSGASGACAGRTQVSESHRGQHMDLVLAGLEQLETLETELDCEFEWRRLGNLMLIEHERHWKWWTEQVAYLKQRNVPAAILNPTELKEAEPLLVSDPFLGAAWCLEGHLNPFKFMQAYAQAARRLGAELRQYSPVIDLGRRNGRLTYVQTAEERFSADIVIVTAGVWTVELLRQAGSNLPVQFTHAEAIISEALPPLLNNHIGLADFYETIHNARQAVSIGVAQQQNGTLLITEAVEQTQRIHRSNSAWGVPAIARELLALFPTFSNVRLVRAWASPSPFLPDEQPAIGWASGLDNCFVATCFHNTITTIPVLSQIIADMILGEQPDIDLSAFNPARFS